MPHIKNDSTFRAEYKETEIKNTVLWESHCHTVYEMISVLEGDICIVPEGRSYRLTAGETAIIPPLHYHTITANKKGLYRRVTVLFDESMIPDVLLPHFQKKGAVLSTFPSKEARELAETLQKADFDFYRPLAESLLTRILYDDVAASHAAPRDPVDENLRSILDYIDAHISHPLTLDDIAAHAARSRSSLSHFFREQMNVSPKQYILQKKLTYAKQLIRDGTPPTLAAMQVGYENYSNFYRMYKKQFGTAPGTEKRNAEP